MEKDADNFDMDKLKLHVDWMDSLNYHAINFTNGLSYEFNDAIFKGFKPWCCGIKIEDGDYLTIRCGLGGIYTCVNSYADGKWFAECLDASVTIAYRKLNKDEEFDSFVKVTKGMSQVKTERDALIEILNNCEKEKEYLVSKIDATKERIRLTTEEYIQKFVNMFEPNSAWKICGNDYDEYFCVQSCEADNYTYREEDVDDCMISIKCAYFRLLHNDTEKHATHNQYNAYDEVTLRIKEIPYVKQITPSEWNKALEKLFTTIKII